MALSSRFSPLQAQSGRYLASYLSNRIVSMHEQGFKFGTSKPRQAGERSHTWHFHWRLNGDWLGRIDIEPTHLPTSFASTIYLAALRLPLSQPHPHHDKRLYQRIPWEEHFDPRPIDAFLSASFSVFTSPLIADSTPLPRAEYKSLLESISSLRLATPKSERERLLLVARTFAEFKANAEQKALLEAALADWQTTEF